MIYSAGYSLAIILVMAAMTFLTRAFPFLFFSKGRQVPQVIAYLGNVLPPAVMGMLIVYSLRAVSYTHLDVYKRQEQFGTEETKPYERV